MCDKGEDMVATIQVNERGTLTLPAHLRKTLGLARGGVVMVEAAEGGLLLRPAVAYPIEVYSEERVREFDRAETRLKQRLARTRRG
jgi:AbrB family looped-hinge helix DNA binding protein